MFYSIIIHSIELQNCCINIVFQNVTGIITMGLLGNKETMTCPFNNNKKIQNEKAAVRSVFLEADNKQSIKLIHMF